MSSIDSDFTFRLAEKSDIDSVILLGREVEQKLPVRGMFQTDERSFYEPVLQGGGSILLAHDEQGGLAGVSVILFPEADDVENLGFDLCLDRQSRAKVRQLDTVFIRADCRGKALAGKLVQKNLGLTVRKDKPYSLATVWPGNVPSLRILFSLGLTLRAFAYKYGGKPRFIAMGGDVLPVFESGQAEVPAMEFDTVKNYFRLGWLGTGLGTCTGIGEAIILFRKPIMKMAV
ncbi:MAG: hypothetical protein J5855_07700 [Mailhella sp.]|nr:hypothetical protein [Mailhella sp.]